MGGTDYERTRAGLRIFLLARFAALGEDEILDLVDASVEAMLVESRAQGRPLDSAGGWLITAAANLAKDKLKRNDPFPQLIAEVEPEDLSMPLLERLAARDDVDRALAAAIEAKDDTCVRVVTTWRDMADQIGAAPTSRAVAEECGYSHTTVRKALARFGRFLP